MYTLMDIEAPANDEIITKLNAIDGVFRVRVVKQKNVVSLK